MNTIIKIAFRNVIANKRRSLLLGLAVFVSSFLLLFSSAALNGVKEQVSKGYMNLQSGDTIVLWEDHKKLSNSLPGRFIDTGNTVSFNIDKEEENLEAIERLDTFLDENKSQIKSAFKLIRRSATLEYGLEVSEGTIVYGLSEENKKHLEDNKVLSMYEGEMTLGKGKLCISKATSEEYDLKVGDTVDLEVVTKDYEGKKKSFEIEGIYNNGAEYDNWYSFMSDEEARDLYEMGDTYFDVTLIFLKNVNKADSFADKLDKYLVKESKVLRAESYAEASTFYNTMPSMYKAMYTVFCIFLLCIIAIGLRSTIKMNIFERMKEFGTFRAIGYSRRQTFSVIFFEILFLSLIALMLAFLVSLGPILYVANHGIFVGTGNLSNALGGETFYAAFKVGDLVVAFIIIIFFSIVATFRPALNLCYQNISDIMIKRQGKVKVYRCLIRSIFKKK